MSIPIRAPNDLTAIPGVSSPRVDSSELRYIVATAVWLLAGILLSYFYLHDVLFRGVGRPFPAPVPLFPPQAIILSVLLLAPVRRWGLWLGIYYATLTAESLAAGLPVWYVLPGNLANIVEPMVGAALFRHFVPRGTVVWNFHQVGLFVACVGVATAIGASGGAAVRALLGYSPVESWVRWFMADVVASLVLTPTIVLWVRSGRAAFQPRSRPRLVEAIALSVGLLISAGGVFLTTPADMDLALALLCLPVPFLIWSAMRFGPCGIMAALSLIAIMAIAGTTNDLGPFAGRPPAASIVTLQLFLLGLGIPLFCLAALVREREDHEGTLERSEAAFRSIFQGSALGIALVGPDGHPMRCNPALERMLGYSESELAAMSFRDFTHPDDVDLGWALFVELIEGKRPEYRIDKRYIHRDGHVVWGRLTASTLPESQGLLALGMMEDITVQHELQEQLRQAQRMEAMGLLAGGVAHDFNNLLTAIIGNTDVLLDRLAEGDPQRELVQEVAEAGDRAASLTRQLLLFSRQDVPHFQIINLNEVVENLEKLLRRVIGEDVALTSSLDPELKLIKADRVQMEQILMNLAVNARDAMPSGGRLTIKTANVQGALSKGDDPLPSVAGVMLAVSDTGIGMDGATRERAFEPFFSTKDIGRGTGLGLATVYAIVQQSGGDISIDSKLGDGTTIAAVFPPAANQTTSPDKPSELPDSSRVFETVLLVEDDPAVRKLASRVLLAQGYQVLIAASGEEALALYQDYPEPVHMILTDIVMPGMNGRELVDALTQIRPGVAVLYMSGYTEDVVVRHGVLEAAVAYLPKPFTPRSLVQKVREGLGALPKQSP